METLPTVFLFSHTSSPRALFLFEAHHVNHQGGCFRPDILLLITIFCHINEIFRVQLDICLFLNPQPRFASQLPGQLDCGPSPLGASCLWELLNHHGVHQIQGELCLFYKQTTRCNTNRTNFYFDLPVSHNHPSFLRTLMLSFRRETLKNKRQHTAPPTLSLKNNVRFCTAESTHSVRSDLCSFKCRWRKKST